MSLLPLMLGLSPLSVAGATYYISMTGHDANPGTQTQPWLTYQPAAAKAQAGDTVLVLPGTYTNVAYCHPKNSGTSNAPIIFRAVGEVTNNFGFRFTQKHIVLDGFIFSTEPSSNSAAWYNKRGAYLDREAGWITISNCTFWNRMVGVEAPPSATKDPVNTAGYCVFENNRFDSLVGGTLLTLMGVGHRVEGNVFANGFSADALRLFGSNVVIRANLFTNIAILEGTGNHPDIMQTFGDNGYWMVDFVFERNHVVDCPVQLMQMVQTEVPDPALWGITVRNNLFENSNMQAGISIPNVKFHNNTFYRCSNGANLLGFSWFDPGASGWRGMAYHSEVLNNAFIECSGFYARNNSGPAQGALTPDVTGGGGRTGIGYLRMRSSGGVWTFSGTYSGLSGTVTSGTIFVVGGNDLYKLDATNFANGSFTASTALVEGAGGYSLANQAGHFNGFRLGFRLNTSTFAGGEISGAITQFEPTPPIDLVPDYNFGSLAGGAPKTGWVEAHNINGGAPGLVGYTPGQTSLVNFVPGELLRFRGRPISGITEDFHGNPRPVTPSIGAFEYEPGDQSDRPTSPQGLRLAELN